MNEALTITHHCHNCRHTFEVLAKDSYILPYAPCPKCKNSKQVRIGDGTMFGTCEALASYVYGQRIHAFTLITDNDIAEFLRNHELELTSANVAYVSAQLKEDRSLLKCVEQMLINAADTLTKLPKKGE